jgi:MinD-like ATPase involved in chromosome partitioning or flagellar assembly
VVQPKKSTNAASKRAPKVTKTQVEKIEEPTPEIDTQVVSFVNEAIVEVAPEVLILDEIKDSLFAADSSIVVEEIEFDAVDEIDEPIVGPSATLETPVEAGASNNEELSTGEVTMPSRRGRARGETSTVPEPVSMLTPDRILEPTKRRPAPEDGFNRFLFFASAKTINLGDSKAVRHRKALDALIGARLGGDAQFVPVLTRKGGVGKTTITTLLGMSLALVREDRVIAIDANPDRGTLAERFTRTTDKTVRDVVNKAASIRSFSDFSQYVSRDKTRLDVLASDTDPMLSEAFDESDYNVVANLVERYYSIALTDCGTGIIHSVMKATLDRADGLVIVSGGSFDEARLAAETLTWLESNGYKHLVRGAIVALNTATQGTQLVNLDEIETHFRSRVREIVRIPYDAQLAAGSNIEFKKLRPMTQEAARNLAALVVDGLAHQQ